MADIDPELRDKIIATHTMMGVMVKSHDEHKSVVNSRMKDAKKEFNEYKLTVHDAFEKHDERIAKSENFRIKLIAYSGGIAAASIIMVKLLVLALKKAVAFL